MPDSVRTTYLTQDPDYGNLVHGFFEEVPFYCAILASAVSTPLATDAILIYNMPADMNGPDFIQESVEATAGNTTSDYVEETFTYIQSKGFSFAGIVQVQACVTIDLDQVDATEGGYANIESIQVELYKYKISTTAQTSLGVTTRTVNRGVAGNTASTSKAEPSLTELFTFDVGLDPQIEIGSTPDYLLQCRIKVTFSAYTASGASTTTIAKCRLNCYRDQSLSSKVLVPVI